MGIISKYEPYFGPDDNFPSTVNAFNSRLSTDISRLSANVEFVIKSADPSAMNLYSETNLLIILSLHKKLLKPIHYQIIGILTLFTHLFFRAIFLKPMMKV